MVKAFQIYKEGVTDNWVTILIPLDIITDELLTFKMNKYLALGYTIKPI